MNNNQSSTIEQHLKQIAEILVLNGTLTGCPGLVHGKTGIAIFFFHYAQYTQNELFADYALDLIGEIQKQIYANSPADYERGIAGIGIGIDYLIQYNFLSTDEDIFGDFDHRMYRAVMYDPCPDLGLYNGLTGYGRYWMMRLRQQSKSIQAKECLLHIILCIKERLSTIPAKEQSDVYCFLHDLEKISGFESCTMLLKQYIEWHLQPMDIRIFFPRFKNSAVCKIAHIYQQSMYFNDIFQIDTALKQISDLDMEKDSNDMGLLTGYTGEGMARLMVIDRADMDWMKLL